MFYSVGGKIVEVGGKIPEKRFNTLTFQTTEDSFPKAGYIEVQSSVAQNIVINYGDGTTDMFSLKIFSGNFRIHLRAPNYDATGDNFESVTENGRFFSDTSNNGTLRNITITFEDIKSVIGLNTVSIPIQGTFPFEVTLLNNLEILYIFRTQLTTIPVDYSGLKNLKTFILIDWYDNPSLKKESLEDWIFSTKIEYLNVSNSYDLSNAISNNFFKINQLADSLDYLNIVDCKLPKLYDEIESLYKLYRLEISSEPVNMKVLERLNPETLTNLGYRWTSPTDYQVYLPYNNLTGLGIGSALTPNMINQIPTQFKELKSLKSFGRYFYFMIKQAEFDLFIDKFYELCTTEGFLDPTSQEAINTGYPEQFRDFSWGDGAYTQTGTIQAPAGFILGSNNGTPANQGEKIYVLINNYGHIVTTA